MTPSYPSYGISSSHNPQRDAVTVFTYYNIYRASLRSLIVNELKGCFKIHPNILVIIPSDIPQTQSTH